MTFVIDNEPTVFDWTTGRSLQPLVEDGGYAYISGPMSGLPEYNFPAFHAAELLLNRVTLSSVSADGEWPRTPVQFRGTSNPAAFKEPGGIGTHNRYWYMRRDLTAVAKCDSIVLIKGWRDSVGANVELDAAMAMGLRIFELYEVAEDNVFLVEHHADPRGSRRSLSQWQREAYGVSTNHGFHDDDDDVTPAHRLLLIIGEINEAFEELRKGHSIDEVYEKDGKPEGVPVEIADAFIRIADFCETYDIDLAEVVEQKNAFNKTRPYKHGKAF